MHASSALGAGGESCRCTRWARQVPTDAAALAARPTLFGGMVRDRAEIAAESLPSDVALLDATGTITWANARWLQAARTGSSGLLNGCTVGVDFLRKLRATRTATAQAIATGVAAVIAGEQTHFEQELIAADGSPRWRLQANPLSGSSRGAVLIRSEVTGPVRRSPWDLPDPEVPARIARLTPRERDVLKLMVRGLNNREIAAELGIAYTPCGATPRR